MTPQLLSNSMIEIQLKSLDDLAKFVEDYNPTKEQLALIIQKRFRLLTFTENFQTSSEILQEFTEVLKSGRPYPIWLGARLTINPTP